MFTSTRPYIDLARLENNKRMRLCKPSNTHANYSKHIKVMKLLEYQLGSHFKHC